MASNIGSRRRRVFASAPAPVPAAGGEEIAETKNSRRRLEASPAVDAREEATMAYIEAHGGRKDKLLVSSERPRVRVRADALRCLAVPLSRDGPERQITGVLLDAALDLLRRRQAERRRNGRRVLLGSVEEQDWLEYVSSLPPRTTAAHDMSATGAKYLGHDMVLFPVNHQSHFFVAALDVAASEYQILDSSNYGHRFGPKFYDTAMSKIRDGVARCMAAAGRADAGAGGWKLRMVAGLPAQTDDSSCGLFAIKCMELWDGEKLARGFTMDDVHELRRKLAGELIFWELNEMQEVKDEIEFMARKMMMMRSSSSPLRNCGNRVKLATLGGGVCVCY
uniref:Ubiquitin-like protease family profile domain-containing protein n=1 Tax=Oryza punctata TaxID=4537 RepID=A0A0E0M8N1_ORYPU